MPNTRRPASLRFIPLPVARRAPQDLRGRMLRLWCQSFLRGMRGEAFVSGINPDLPHGPFAYKAREIANATLRRARSLERSAHRLGEEAVRLGSLDVSIARSVPSR